MKLSSVRISEFQSIRDSNLFEIGDVTCLVGKNEAGKTALLRALERLNPVITIPSHSKFDVIDDYPRAEVTNYQQEVESGQRPPATVVEATFHLDPEEVKDINSEFGSGIVENNVLILSKGYENKLDAHLNVNEKLAVKSIVSSAELPEALSQELLNSSKIEDLGVRINSKSDAQYAEKINRLKTRLAAINQAGGVTNYIYSKYLQKSTPKFMYFDEYYVMKGHENIQALKSRVANKTLKESDYPLLGLIELARLNLDQLLNPNRTEGLINLLEGASNHLSSKVLKYWSQNKHLHIKFDVRAALPGDPAEMTSGTNIWARIDDSKRKVSTPLGTRSRGFVWFFSFLAWFDQQQRKNEPFILLLDEPGLFLHGTAQADLLRYIDEELKGHIQVIYTTHSPFMVDPTKFNRIRIVQDKSTDSDEFIPINEDGTKVITEVLEATHDSLFPLQGALGYEIYQTLFVGPNSLVVEGVSDLLYLQTISSLLDSKRRVKLNTNWTITPVGGADKVPTFVALLGAQKGLKLATLIDLQKKDQQNIQNLYKKKLLKKENVFTFADFTGSTEGDIEDMFGAQFYLDLVNSEYSADLKTAIKLEMLNLKSPRILLTLEQFFSDNPLKNGTLFNHYRPARYFAENISKLDTKIPAITLDKFEAAFKALNALL